MFVCSLYFCRRIAGQKPSVLICKRLFNKNPFLGSKNQILKGDLVMNKDVFSNDFYERISQSDIIKTAKLLNEYPSEESIEWDELLKKMMACNIKNIRPALLQAFLRLHFVDAGLSYYNYLIEKDEKLSLVDVMFFTKLLSAKKDEILKYEYMIKYLYENIKEYMTTSPVIQSFILDLIAEVPSCFFDFVKTAQTHKNTQGYSSLVIKAFELDQLKIALDIIGSQDFIITEKVVEAYLNFMIRMALKNKFVPHLITEFASAFEKKISTVDYSAFFSLIDSLVEALMKCQSDYIWSVDKCRVSETGVCSCCQLKLVDKPISEAEFNCLKEDFLTKVMYDKSVFLSSSEKELNNFFSFLKTCKPYDIVLDGLNLYYQRKVYGIVEFNRYLKYFVDKGLRVMVIAKQHAQRKLSSAPFLMKKSYSEKIQYFITDNNSDDDVFLLYAALHQGLGTYLVSGDFLAKYGSRLSTEYQDIYLKWKTSHQYIMKSQKLFPPQPHLGVPQLTTSPEENGRMFVWHISYKSDTVNSAKLNSNTSLNWVCLKAEKKRYSNVPFCSK